MAFPIPPTLTPPVIASGFDSPTIQAILAEQQKAADMAAAQQAVTGHQLDMGMNQFAQLSAAAPQQVNPTAEFATNLAGGISQAIAPSMGGQQAAAQALKFQKDKFAQQHALALDALQMNLGRLAQRYQDEGNHEAAAAALAKQTKAQVALNDLQAKNDAAARFSQEQAGLAGKVFDAQTQAADTAAKNKVLLQINANNNATSRFKIEQGAKNALVRAKVATLGADGELIPTNGAASYGEMSKQLTSLKMSFPELTAAPDKAVAHNNAMRTILMGKATDELSNPVAFAQRRLMAVGNPIPEDTGKVDVRNNPVYKLTNMKGDNIFQPSEVAQLLATQYTFANVDDLGKTLETAGKLTPVQALQALQIAGLLDQRGREIPGALAAYKQGR